MIIVMKEKAKQEQIDTLMEELVRQGMNIQVNQGVHCTVLGVIGDTGKLDAEGLSMKEGVDRVMRVQEPFKKSNRKFHDQDTVVQVGPVRIGGGTLSVVAGPCSVENTEQICGVASAVAEAGAKLIRGGAYKPRTSPYAFQGLEKEGLEMLREARERTGLPIVSEIISPRHVEMFEMVVDVIQIGARNMQNFDLLKRGLSSTVEEWLMSAEYIMSRGNDNVILCERGIRTFETYTRNTLDLSAVVAVKRLSHLPVMVDPSHGTGRSYMVEPMALAAIAAGADGLVIEVHNDPVNALSDGPQSLTPEQFQNMMVKIRSMAELAGKTC